MKRFLSGLLATVLVLSIFADMPLRVAASMSSSDAFIEVLKKIEGFSEYPYEDGPQWTVGYGTRCPDDKLEEYKANGISREEAQELLEEMLADFEASVNSFAQRYELTLSQHEFDALVSFTYNCGSGWMSDTDGTFNKAVREGKTGSEFVYSICLWSSASGEYILMNRRLAEANMYLNGVYEAYNDSSDGTYPDTYKYVYLDGNGGTSRNTIHGYDAADPIAVITDFSKIPSSASFDYEFAGWYTEETGGTKVDVLDGSLTNGAILYAHWKNPEGNEVSLPKGELCMPQPVTVTSGVNVRSGPGTFYPKLGKLSSGDSITITQTFTRGNTIWGKFEDGWVSLSYTDYFDVIWPRTGVVNANKVNVRSGPSTSYASQYKLNTGDAVTIHERKYGAPYYWGRLSDGNWIALQYVTLDPYVPDVPELEEGVDPIPGDVDCNSKVDTDDVILLLLHVSMPDVFVITVDADFNEDGLTNTDDVIQLLLYVSMPDVFPL